MTGSLINRGRDTWLLKYDLKRAPGEKRKQAYKTVRGSKREAAAELARLTTAVHDGEHIDRNTVTLAAYIDNEREGWLKRASVDLSAQSLERYKQIIDHQLRPHIGNVRLQDLTTARAETMLADLRSGDRPIAPRTARQVLMLLNRIIRSAVKDRLMLRNILDDIDDRPKAPKKRVTPLTPEQVQEVIAALEGKKIRLPVLIALYSGMRRGEILALKWNDLDLDAATIRVDESVEETKEHGRRVKTPKTDSGNRDISIGPGLVSELRSYRQWKLERRMRLGLGRMPDDALLFTSPQGEPVSPNGLSEGWNLFAKSIGLKGATFHTLRHTHASHLIRQGVDIVTVSRRLGHSSPAFTMATYAHMIPGGDAHAAEAIDKALGTI